MRIFNFGRNKRIIEERISELGSAVEDLVVEHNFLVDQCTEFKKQVGLRTGMNPGTSSDDLFIRLDALQRACVVRNLAKDILSGVDWKNGNPSQEEIVTASIAALEVLK